MRDGKVSARPATPHGETAAKGEKDNEKKGWNGERDNVGHEKDVHEVD